MSTKSRHVIWGGKIMGAEMRAQGAGEAVQQAIRDADRGGGGVVAPHNPHRATNDDGIQSLHSVLPLHLTTSSGARACQGAVLFAVALVVWTAFIASPSRRQTFCRDRLMRRSIARERKSPARFRLSVADRCRVRGPERGLHQVASPSRPKAATTTLDEAWRRRTIRPDWAANCRSPNGHIWYPAG
jgi:hypothetical protein